MCATGLPAFSSPLMRDDKGKCSRFQMPWKGGVTGVDLPASNILVVLQPDGWATYQGEKFLMKLWYNSPTQRIKKNHYLAINHM